MKLKNLRNTFIVCFIIIIVLLMYFCIPYSLNKEFFGYKIYTSDNKTEEIKISIAGTVNHNLMDKDEYRVKITIENENQPFDGELYTRLYFENEDFQSLIFEPEFVNEAMLVDGKIKTDNFQSYILILRSNTDQVFLATTKGFESLSAIAEYVGYTID